MDQERTYKWIQEKLSELRSGTLSDADRILLEDMSATDPFLKDALEGYHAHANHDHSVLLDVLSNRIRQKRIAKHVKLRPLSRGIVIQAIAASLVLILATWSVIYYAGKEERTVTVTLSDAADYDNDETTMSKSDETNQESIVATEEQTQISVTDELNADPPGLRTHVLENQAKAKAKEKNQAQAKAEAKESDDYTFSASKPATSNVAAKEVTEETSAPESPMDVQTTDLAIERASNDEGYYANQMRPEMMRSRASGQVVDATTGEPLIGALIRMVNTNISTQTDLYGHFEIFLPTKTETIVITYTGYEDQQDTVHQGEENIVIVMQEGAMIPPMIIRQLGVNTNRIDFKFNDYIKKNSNFPINNEYTSFDKVVIYEFEINNKGLPVNLKLISKQANSNFANEAKRLIENYTYWICENEKYPCRKSYTINFE